MSEKDEPRTAGTLDEVVGSFVVTGKEHPLCRDISTTIEGPCAELHAEMYADSLRGQGYERISITPNTKLTGDLPEKGSI